MCLHVCPHGVLEKDNGAVRIAELDACMECGACVKNCPHEALYVKVGVGCATAVLNAALGRTSACCCIVEDEAEESKSARCC
jgi:Fe-S-cluster-containing hydrogenase component 2